MSANVSISQPLDRPEAISVAGVHFAASLEEMKALPNLKAGETVYVGPRADQFIAVDDDSLGTDGGTVFIPDSELSAVYEEAIPIGFFTGAYGAEVAREYDLAHTGIDFESVELVLTDAGETLDIWYLHGHVMSPNAVERVDTPQLPLIDTGRGKFRDPWGVMTGNRGANYPNVRTGGALLRYKYATSGLRLKRIAGPVFRLDWWPVVAVDEEASGEQTDNSGRICWCANAAAAAKAEAVLVTKMYHYQRCVEWPEYVELRGLGPGQSGFRVMDNGQFKELLLSASSAGAAHDQTKNPMLTPSTRLWNYDSFWFSQATTFFPATGARRIRISGIEWDGNIENNMRLFTQRENEYAWKYANTSIHLFNVPASLAYAGSNHGNRVIPEGQVVEFHNIKAHGYGQGLLGNHNTTFIGTGLIEVGDLITGHNFYLLDGVFERIRCFGYFQGDGLRCRHLEAKSVEFIATPQPEALYFLTTLPTDERSYIPRQRLCITTNEKPQTSYAVVGFAYPKLSPARVVINFLFIDASGMDNWPQAYTAYESIMPFFIGADDIQIKSGKLRYGNKVTLASFLFTNAATGIGNPPRNQLFENLHIEYGTRKGFTPYQCGGNDAGPSQLTFRNITVEPRAATHNQNDSGPDGVSICLGNFRFKESVMVEPVHPAYDYGYDGRDFDFSAVTPDATLNGKYIDITPPDDGAPTFRLWFNYNAAGTAPVGTGVTLIPVPVPAAPTPTTAIVAAAFSAAIAGTITVTTVASPYLTAATFNTKSVVGSFSNYRGGTKGGYVATSVANAAGVTTALRAYRRNFERSLVSFDGYIAPDPTYQALLDINEIGPNRDVYFKFDHCIFGAHHMSMVGVASLRAFSAAGTNAADVAKDRIHFAYRDTTFDLRDTHTNFNAVNMDLLLYCSTFNHCRIRTPRMSTGITTMGPGYEVLYSEQSGIHVFTPTAGATFIEIQTKLFWQPKEGQLRFYPADAPTAVVWNTNMPAPEWRKCSKPVGGTSAAMLTTSYYQGGTGTNEDRRAPVLRLNFATPLAATQLKIGWSAAVSP